LTRTWRGKRKKEGHCGNDKLWKHIRNHYSPNGGKVGQEKRGSRPQKKNFPDLAGGKGGLGDIMAERQQKNTTKNKRRGKHIYDGNTVPV